MEISQLLGADECAEFQECYRTKRVCVHPSGNLERFRWLWEEWEMDALCRFTPLTQVDRFRLVRDAKRVPPAVFRDRLGMVRADAVKQLFAGGVTVSVANLEFYSDLLLSISRGLERLVASPAQFSYYATPKSSQALAAHRDEHDVLVLQLRGSKHWDIYHAADDTGREAETPQQYTLHRGSWLYVPKNVKHEVKNVGEEPSVHLTIGFHPLTWGTIFQGALEQANMASRALNEQVPSDPRPTDSAEVLTERLRCILPFVNVAEQTQEFYRQLPHFGEAVPGLVARDAVESVGAESRLVWRTDNVSLEIKAGIVALNTPYRRTPLELRPELEPVMKTIAGGAVFRPADLGFPEVAVAVQFCKFLSLVGALRLVP